MRPRLLVGVTIVNEQAHGIAVQTVSRFRIVLRFRENYMAFH